MADLVKGLRQAGIAKHKEGDFKAALALYARAMAFAPDDAETLTNMGVILRQTKQFHEALALQRRAITIAPENRAIRVNCANILEDTGHHDEAADLRRSLLEDEPNSSPNQALLVRSLRNAGRVDEARALLDTYLAGDNPGPELRLEHGIFQLAYGHYAEGFRHYLARREAKLVDLPEVNLPRWTGQPLKGKRVLFLPEQGIGDTINFVRFLPYLKDRGAEVHLITRPPMHRLLQTLPEADAVLSEPVKGAGYHYWTSGLDVPVDYFHFRDDVPPPLRPTPPQDSRKRAGMFTAAHADRFKVGCVWRGAEGYDRNAMRSMPHGLMRELAEVPEVQLFSLYKGPALDAYLADGSAATMLDTASTDRDLADCAAMIEAMDLVVTVDTVTAHIAGTLGKPVWNLLHWEPFWLYGPQGDTTPWYDTMRLFRQTAPFDWSDVMAEVRRDLTTRAAEFARERGT